MLFVIDEAAVLGIAHFKQLSHFVKTDFDNLRKKGSQQLTWNSWCDKKQALTLNLQCSVLNTVLTNMWDGPLYL